MVVGQLIFGPGEAQLRFAIAGRDIRAMLLSRPTLIYMRLGRITACNGSDSPEKSLGFGTIQSKDPKFPLKRLRNNIRSIGLNHFTSPNILVVAPG